MTRILVAGHVCVDVAPGLLGPPQLGPGALVEIGAPSLSVGGPVGNTGLRLADSGLDVVVDAVVGDDHFGRVVVDILAGRGIDTSRITVDNRFATSYSVILEPPGIDRTIWHHPGANNGFDGTHVDLGGVDLLHLGYPPLLPGTLTDDGAPLYRLLARAKEAGLTTSVDLAVVDPQSPVAAVDWRRVLERVLPLIDVFSPSWDDLLSMGWVEEATPGPDALRATVVGLLAGGAGVVAVSAGAMGLHLGTAGCARLAAGGRGLAGLAPAWADQRVVTAPAPVERVVTTNGAGDASTAGLLYGLTRGDAVADAAAWAGRFAALSIAGQRSGPEQLAGSVHVV